MKNFFSAHPSRVLVVFVMLLIVVLRTTAGEQTNSIALTVGGAVEQPLNLTISDLSRLPRTKLTVTERDGKEVVFEGVALSEIVSRAKPMVTKQCCSNTVNAVVQVHAADGYRAVFALPELDPEFTDNKVLLADRRAGEPMTAPQGPLRLVVPNDKARARWVRQVITIEILFVGASTNAPAR